MSELAGLGRFLIVAGVAVVLIGLVLAFSDRLPFLNWLGRLPGDIVFRRGDTTIYIPIVTSILVSVIVSLILTLLFRRQ